MRYTRTDPPVGIKKFIQISGNLYEWSESSDHDGLGMLNRSQLGSKFEPSDIRAVQNST